MNSLLCSFLLIFIIMTGSHLVSSKSEVALFTFAMWSRG